jgi:hypothetical protein
MRRPEGYARREDEPTRPVRVPRIRAVRNPPAAIGSEDRSSADEIAPKVEAGGPEAERGFTSRW